MDGHLRLVSDHSIATAGYGLDGYLFDEFDFNEMLNREKKRSQRSMKPLMLMCLDISGIVVPSGTHELHALLKALATCIRETDVLGWYKQESVIGILFTEIESVADTARENLFRRVMAHLVRQAGPVVLFKIKVSFHIYPGSKEQDKNAEHFDMRYYRYHSCKTEKQDLTEKINRPAGIAHNCKTFTALIVESLQCATPQSTLE
jgi:GGDEF domain-containing protein